LIAAEHRNNPSIFPGKEELHNSFVGAPLNPSLQRLTTRLWQEFKTQRQ
jgi:hypothetical protein